MSHRTVDDHLTDAIRLNARQAVTAPVRIVRDRGRRVEQARADRAPARYSARHARRHPRAATPARAVGLWLRRCAVVVLLLVAAGLVGMWWSAPVPAPTPADYPVVRIGDVDPSPVVAP